MAALVAMAVGAASNIVSAAAKPLFQKIKRGISYMFKYQSNIDGLKNQVKELDHKREMVKEPVNRAKRQGEEIYQGVEGWLNSVDDFTEKVVKPITCGEDEAKKRCFKGLCPKLFKRYNLSKKALKATKECADLLERGNFNTVSYRPAPYLGSLVNQLELLRRRVEKNIEHAEGQGEEIHDDVKDWLTRVKNLTDKADKTTKEVEDLLGKGNFSTFSYLRTPDLESLVKELEFLRQRVEKDVEHAERQGEEIFNDVNDWLTRAKNFTDKTVNGDVAVKECSDLLGRGNFPKVSYRPAPDKTELMHVKDYEQFDSRMEVFQQVMEALKDNKFNIIGVHGMGGVGKTTLVKKVAQQVTEDKLFDKVVMAEVTQTPDYMTIQSKIANDLGMKFDLNESVLDRADRLRERLKKEKRLLVVLDNIWTKLELHEVGIPFQNEERERKDEQRRCTIILTSRKLELLQNDMNTVKDFSIEVLSKNEAWKLFEKIVGDSSKKSDFQPIADEIVGKCGGLPVALITIANALKNNKSLLIWKDALDRLRNSNAREIHGMDANVYSSIELSYNYLESDEAKSLFLLCGLHRAGDSINVFDLLRYGMGLGLFKNVYNLEAARNRVHWLIDSLKASCLLLVGDAEDEVKMHDVIHVVAISIAAEKLMFNIPDVDVLTEEIQKMRQKDTTDISLHCRDVYELPEKLECLQLRLFLLFTKGGSSWRIPEFFFNRMQELEGGSSWRIPEFFFNGMQELKVLLLDGINCIPSLPSSLGCLINLQTLCLDGCQLKDITIVGQLKGLKILSFRDSNIEQLPLEIGHLTRLQQLDLRNCWRLKVIAPNVISKLSRLEELYMGDSFFIGWEKAEEGENASLVELKGLSKLTTLEIHIPNAETIPQDLVSVELERFKILIGNVQGWYDKNETSRLMNIHGMEKSILLENYRMKMLLKETEDLYLEELNGFQNVVHELDDDEGFFRLKHFHVKNCSEILHIVSSGGRVHSKVFPLLESLLLHSLINLEKVCQGQITDDQSFSNLRIIKVIGCVRLNHLFSFSMAKNLLRLRKVVVSDCKNMKMIVGRDMEKPTTTLGFEEIIAENDPHEKVIFPSLEELELVDLQELTNFAVGIKSVEFPSLVKVDIAFCFNLRTFISMSTSEENTQSLFNEKGQLTDDQSFSNLRIIKVKQCVSLKHLFSFSMAKNLLRLQNVEVRNCKKMEMIVGPDMEKSTTTLGFKEIVAEDVPQEKDQLTEDQSFNNLKTIKVRRCVRLNHLFSFSTAKNLLRLRKVVVSECKNMKMIVGPDMENPTTTLGFKEIVAGDDPHEKVIFPSLEVLELFNLQELTSFTVGIKSVEFPSLLKVGIWNCSNLRRFISVDTSEENTQPLFDEKVALPNLEVLKLIMTKNLTHIWDDHLAFDSFSKLKELEIFGRSQLRSIFPSMIALPNLEVLKLHTVVNLTHIWDDHLASDSFCKLKKLEIFDCSKLRSIFPPMIALPSLEELKIEWMDNLTHIWDDHLASDSFRKLKELTICDCCELTSIFPPMVAFPSLMTLHVLGCDGLRSLMTLSTAESMVNLTTLKVWSCERMEEIIEEQVGEENVKEHRMLFNIELVDLPSLTCFCSGNYTLEFSSLERVWVLKCPNMKTFSQGVILVTPKLHKVQETFSYNDEGRWEGNLNSTIQKMYKEMLAFRDIWVFKLSLFPNLKEIWHSQALPVSIFNNLTDLTVDDCTNMSIAIPTNLLRYLNNLDGLKVSNCDSLEEMFHLEELNADEHSGLVLFPKLMRLELINLPKLQKLCSFTGNIIKFLLLYTLTIENCPNMEAFISNSTDVHMTANKEPPEMTSEKNSNIQPFFDEYKVSLPILENVKLSRLPKLLHLWNENSQPSKAFQNLKTLEVSKCDGLINMATLSTVESLVNLERMEITGCKMIQEIIQVLGEEVEECIVFNKLKYLGLDCLPSLTNFCLGKLYTFEFPSLERVLVRECPNMSTFSHGVLHTPKLHKVQVKEDKKEDDDEYYYDDYDSDYYDEEDDDEGYDDDDDEEGDVDEGRWEGNLNSTIQQLFKEMHIGSLPMMVAGLWSTDDNMQLEATKFLKLLSIEASSLIEEVIRSGVVGRFVEFLRRGDFPQLQFEAAWALRNIASGTSEDTNVVIDHGAIPIFVELLASPSDDVREQVVWALGNVAGDSPRCRDFVLSQGALIPLLAQLNEHAKLSMLRNATWTLSNFVRGKPEPPFDQVRLALPSLAQLVHSNDNEVLSNACWALYHLSDGANDKIQAVIEAGVCPRLVELLGHPSPSVLIPALQTVANIVTGDDFQTQCIINHGALLYLLGMLTHNHKESIKKVVCRTISNITAGNREQIQAVIDAGLIGPLVNLLQDDEFDIKGEAAWAISNATAGGTHEQIKYLVSRGCIKPLCDLFLCSEPRIVTVCLEVLENILKVGEAEKNMSTAAGDVNKYAQLVEEAEGLEKIEILRSHDNNEINEKAIKILQTYWLEKE